MNLASSTTRTLLFIAAALFLFFFLLNSIPLWSSDEGRYGEIAREMFETGDFIIPRFHEVPYLDKPVLAPILTAGAYALFGVNAFATRLIPALAALLGLAMTHFFARRVFEKRTADFSALLLLTTVGYVLVGRFAVIDMLMNFWVSLSLFWMFLAFWEKKPHFYLLAYVFMGLAALTKGLIGFVIPGFVFFIFLAWTRNLKELLRMKLPAGILIIAVLFLPWLFAAMKKHPGFFDVFIVEQHFKRFATGTFGRRRPFWFFIPIFFALAAPWTFFFPAAVKNGLKLPPAERLKIQFLISWIAGVVIFFSIPKSKLPYYILPVCMPLALLVGNFLAKKNFKRAVPWMAGTVYGGLLITFIVMKIISSTQSTYDEAVYLKSVLQPGDRVATYASPDRFSDLPFHLKDRILLLGPDFGTLQDQLDRLPAAEREKHFMGREEFIPYFNSDAARIYVLMTPKWFEEIKRMGLRDFQVLREGNGKVLVVNK